MCLDALTLFCFLAARTHLSATGHTAAQIGAVLVVYGLLFRWLRANQEACLSEAYDEATQEVAGPPGSPSAVPDALVEMDGRAAELPPSLHPRSV